MGWDTHPVRIDQKGFVPIRDVLTALQLEALKVSMSKRFDENHASIDLPGLFTLLSAQDLVLIFLLNEKMEAGQGPGSKARMVVTAVIRRTDPREPGGTEEERSTRAKIIS